MTYQIVVLARATEDIERCYRYIKERSPVGARNWFDRFSETKAQLTRDPLSRGLAYESQFVEYDIREVIFGTRKGLVYRVLYTVAEQEVRILRVRGPGQDFVLEEDLDS